MSKVQDDEFKMPDVTNLKVADENNTSVNTNRQQVILFCIPGKTFSNRFVVLWSELLLQCLLNGYRPVLCQENDKNIYISRNKCLGANLLSNDEDQKPFQGKIEYDYLVWLDPNVVFTFNEIKKVLESPYDVTTGLYLLTGDTTNVVKNMSHEFYLKNGTFDFVQYENILDFEKEDNRYFQVDFTDLGFACFKKGVIEKLKYPWFSETTKEPVALFTDSYTFCQKLKDNGIKIYADANTKMKYIDSGFY